MKIEDIKVGKKFIFPADGTTYLRVRPFSSPSRSGSTIKFNAIWYNDNTPPNFVRFSIANDLYIVDNE